MTACQFCRRPLFPEEQYRFHLHLWMRRRLSRLPVMIRPLGSVEVPLQSSRLKICDSADNRPYWKFSAVPPARMLYAVRLDWMSFNPADRADRLLFSCEERIRSTPRF